MIVQNNNVMQKTTGKVGLLVFRKLRGKTVVSWAPKKPDPSLQTEPQRQTRRNFKDAAVYAKAALLIPEKLAYYQHKAKKLKLPNAYTAAVTDYMRKGKMEDVDRNYYHGKKDDKINVFIEKRGFAVRDVSVTLSTSTGTVIEKGRAVYKDAHWIYIATVTVEDKNDVVISVDAIDTDGRIIV
jgi:hypothetical protein